MGSSCAPPLDWLAFLRGQSGHKALSKYFLPSKPRKKNGKSFNVNDHINQSGYNPLIGKQSFYSVDFVDIANLYQQSEDGIITNCCGKKINHKHSFPNHYLHSISILLRVFKCEKIYAKLINIYE